jgi:hypothetical protein
MPIACLCLSPTEPVKNTTFLNAEPAEHAEKFSVGVLTLGVLCFLVWSRRLRSGRFAESWRHDA